MSVMDVIAVSLIDPSFRRSQILRRHQRVDDYLRGTKETHLI